MKIKVLSRHPDDYIRETKNDIFKMPRNYQPSLHPFEIAREYTRSLNAVKLQKLFAKPFVGNLHGHSDGISCLNKHPSKLSLLLSGACDGEKCVKSLYAHEGFIRGIAFNEDNSKFYTCGNDKKIHLWNSDFSSWQDDELPINTILSKKIINSITHHMHKPIFATCGEDCDIWDESRNEPVNRLSWDADNLYHIRFNPIQVNLLASCASDCSIILYDLRGESPIRKVTLNLKSNSLCWNPMEAFIFTVANEDYNLYSFDLRKLSTAVNVYKDHTSAVIDLDYAPTGKEIVAGSYDKTIRIFPVNKSHSRDIYHTRRMQRLTSVVWSLDNNYIITGSDEMNIRIWKSNASAKLGLLHQREKADLQYNQQLMEKYKAYPEVKRIFRYHHVPKHVYNARKELCMIAQSQKRKEANKRAHSFSNKNSFITERKKHIRAELE